MHLTRYRAGIAALALLLCPTLALAQRTPVFQSGTMKSGDIAKFFTNGMIGDASLNGILGDLNGNGLNPFAIGDKNALGVCSYTNPTSAATNRICLGHDTAGNPIIEIDSLGGGTLGTPGILVNGTLFPLLGSVAPFNATGQTVTVGNPTLSGSLFQVYTVVVNKTVGAATTITLPASGIPWQIFRVKDGKGDAFTNPITVSGNGNNIDGAATDLIDINYASRDYMWDGTKWQII